MAAKALLVISAFVLQTLLVFAGNSRLFGLLQPGSGWYTNVEMSQRYASLVTPAKWAFAIWGIIYMWEMVAVAYLAFARSAAFWQGSAPTMLWVAANVFQGAWALCFATERLSLAAVMLAAIAASLVGLAFALRSAGGLDYWLVAAPVWLHAGWTTAASIVNLNLVVGLIADTSTQLAAAHASAFLACAAGVSVVVATAGDASSSSPFVAAPLVAALCWALAAIRAELAAPTLITSSAAYAEIGEVGRAALQLVVGGSAVVLGAASAVIASTRLVGGQWLELK